MNEPVSEKNILLMALNDMNKQLKELNSALEASFTDLRSHWFYEEEEKLTAFTKRVSNLEDYAEKINSPDRGEFTNYSLEKKQTRTLKLELGFH